MNKLITLEVFTSNYDIRFLLLKDMLEEAGIGYITTNEVASRVKPLLFGAPANVAMELRVYQEDLEEARKILDSIE